MTDTFSASEQQQWTDDGYVVIRNAIPTSLLDELLATIDGIMDSAIAGMYTSDVNWIDRENRVPHFLNDLLSPEKYHPSFGQLLSEVTLPRMHQLIGDNLRTSWMMLLTGGAGHPYSVGLHRDNSKIGVPNEQEMLDRYDNQQCYFQAALLPDSFLEVVPGSHRRPATPEETEAAQSTTFCTSEQVSGLTAIELAPGDIIIRSTNLLHQGKNPSGKARWTLVSAAWENALPIVPVEQNDYKSFVDKEFCETLPAPLKEAVQRYLQAHQEARFEDVVF